MSEKIMVPNLRFKGFDGEWEEKKLGDVCNKLKSGGTPRATTKEFYDGSIPFLSISDFDSKYLTKTKKFVSELGINNSSSYIVEKGNLILSIYATIGKPIINKIDVAIPQSVLGIFLKKNYEKDFFYQSFLTKEKWFDKNKQKGTQANLSLKAISQMSFLVPSLQEQEKIARFFSKIDDLIALNERKLETLKKTKKYYLLVMFPKDGESVPQLRFKGFDGEWERNKIVDIFQVTRGFVLSKLKVKSEPINEFKYPVYSSQTLNKGLMGYYSESIYENSITWTTDGVNAGTVSYRKGKFYCTNVCGVLLEKKEKPSICFSEIMNKEFKKHVIRDLANPKLMNKVVENIYIKYPKNKQEQEKIAHFFSKMDDEIDLQEKKIHSLKETKKYYLKNMFL